MQVGEMPYAKSGPRQARLRLQPVRSVTGLHRRARLPAGHRGEGSVFGQDLPRPVTRDTFAEESDFSPARKHRACGPGFFSPHEIARHPRPWPARRLHRARRATGRRLPRRGCGRGVPRPSRRSQTRGIADAASDGLARDRRRMPISSSSACRSASCRRSRAKLRTPFPRAPIVTDVGSVKAPVVAELGAIFRGRGRFVGSHPMAGSEQTGIAAARAGLVRRRGLHRHARRRVGRRTPSRRCARFWEALGCRVLELSPAEHDEIVALISHLPHLLAAALVNTVGRGKCRAPSSFCGPGFRDTTRVAAGPPAMWAEILAHQSRRRPQRPRKR